MPGLGQTAERAGFGAAASSILKDLDTYPAPNAPTSGTASTGKSRRIVANAENTAFTNCADMIGPFLLSCIPVIDHEFGTSCEGGFIGCQVNDDVC